MCSSGKGGTHDKDLCTCMCGSAHDCGGMVNSSGAMAAIGVILLQVNKSLKCKHKNLYIILFKK